MQAWKSMEVIQWSWNHEGMIGQEDEGVEAILKHVVSAKFRNVSSLK